MDDLLALIGPMLTHINRLEVNSEVVPAPYLAKTHLLMVSLVVHSTAP